MSGIHRVKYEGHRKFVSGSAAADVLNISGATFSYLKSHKKLDLETRTFGNSQYYSLRSVREFAKRYRPYKRTIEAVEVPEAVVEAPKPDLDALLKVVQELKANVAQLQNTVETVNGRINHLYSIWK